VTKMRLQKKRRKKKATRTREIDVTQDCLVRRLFMFLMPGSVFPFGANSTMAVRT
jgi:hypothetical protein